MAKAPTNTMGAEFQSLPLDYLVAAPLIAAVKAQRLAAETTKEFVESMIDSNGEPTMVKFSVDQDLGDGTQKVNVNAPLLAMVPVPHLRIDSLTTKFTFEIKQTFSEKSETAKGVEMKAKVGGNPWVSASIKGSASSKSSQESTTNRSGQLEVTVQASESEIPEGLARVLSMMASAIQPPGEAKKP